MAFSLSITDYYPSPNEKDVDRTTTIRIAFNRDIKETTLTGNFLVHKYTESGYTPVTGTISYREKKAIFTPSSPFDVNSQYRVTVIGDSAKTTVIDGIQDIFGEGMIGNLQYVFTTSQSTVLDKTVMTKPISNTNFTDAPEISWEAVTGADTYEVEVSAASDFSVDVWETTINDGSISVTPGTTLTDGTYFCRVRYSKGGNYSPWSDTTRFFIEELMDVEEEIIDNYIEIVSASPINGCYNIDLGTTFTFAFDTDVSDSASYTVTARLVELPFKETALTPMINGKKVSVSPTYVNNKQYKIYINIAGTKSLYEEYEYSFSSAYTPLYCTYNDVLFELGSIGAKISPDIIYIGIRDASLYAKQLRESIEAANVLLTATDWEDIDNLPIYIKQYVRFQGAFNALSSTFYVDKAARSGEMRQLADFIAQDYTGAEAGIEKVLDMLRAKAKSWLDQIMEYGIVRGYAKPVSATKGENVAEYQNWHTRTW